MVNRKTFVSICIASLMLAAAPGAMAQARTVIKLGWATADNPHDPASLGANAFKAALEASTKGAIEVQLYPNRQLGDDKPMLEGLRFGTVDSAIITNAVVAQLEPAYTLNDLPFIYTDENHVRKVLDGKVGAELARKLDAKGITTLGYLEAGFRNMINNKKPITVPGDVNGVKFRVMQSPVYIDMFNSLGGSAVPMAWGETFTAVQQGMIDGLELPLNTIDSLKVYEVTKYLSQTNHTFTVLELLISKRAMARLTEDQRKAVIEAGKVATAQQRKANSAQTAQMIGILKSKGMTVNAVNDPAAFRKAVLPMYEKYRAAIGSDLLNTALETK
ncbi:MAG: TRAP transporter substrate-binding protein [Comamonadaceae bacterium]|nr:MAG: TRAP transporter substrate-binding protein [Comamonadaceae bacterium]